MNPTDIVQVFLSLFGSGLAVFIALPAIKEIVGVVNSDNIRIAVSAFIGSGAAGISYVYLKKKYNTFRLLFEYDHVIVCGLNDRSMRIVNDLVSRGKKPVIIESDARNPHIESCKGLIVLVGNPSNPKMLNLAGVKKAKHILSFDDLDENNAEVALNVKKIVPDKKKQNLTCTIQILSPQLYGTIRSEAFRARKKGSSVNVEFFNQYALGARIICAMHHPFMDQDVPTPLPVILIGAGRLGESLITRIARIWYTKHRNDGLRLPITIVDINALRIRDGLLVQNPKISASCELIAKPVDIQSAEFRKGEFLKNSEFPRGFVAYICLDDDSLGLCAALTLTLPDFCAGVDTKHIVLRTDHNTSVAKLIAAEQSGIGNIRGIYPVNISELTSDSQLILAGEAEILARSIHENYCKKERLKGQTLEPNRLLVTWDELGDLTKNDSGIDGEKYRESNRSQANNIWTKISQVGCEIGPITDWDAPFTFRFSSDEIEQLAHLEHERWIDYKQNDGWVYGTERNDSKKLHPSLVPYEQLSEAEKEKDRDTIRQIPEILSLIDFQLYRR